MKNLSDDNPYRIDPNNAVKFKKPIFKIQKYASECYRYGVIEYAYSTYFLKKHMYRTINIDSKGGKYDLFNAFRNKHSFIIYNNKNTNYFYIKDKPINENIKNISRKFYFDPATEIDSFDQDWKEIMFGRDFHERYNNIIF